MFSEMYYNKIQIYVIKIFEMTHPPYRDRTFHNVAFKIKPYIFKIFYIIINKYINNYHFKRNNNIFY